MTVSPILQITQVAANQNQKEVTINNGVIGLENATQAPMSVSLAAGNAATLSLTQFVSAVCFTCSGQTAAATLTVPLSKRLFLVENNSGSYQVTVGGLTGASVVVPALTMMLIYCDSVNCTTITVASVGVSSVVGFSGVVTLANLIAGGVMPVNNANPTGTMDASAATAVKVPTVAISDNSTNAASTAMVQALVSSVVQGLQPKPAAQWATTAALPSNTYSNGTAGVGATLTATANGALTVDGGAVALNDIVLVLFEGTPSHNGLYQQTQLGDASHPYILTRHVDMDSSTKYMGATIVVEAGGTTNNNSLWLCTNASAPTVGTTAITFTELNKLGDVLAGAGLDKSGNTMFLQAFATGMILANISGGSASPTPHTLTAILDALLGSTDGDVATRQSGAWTAVTALAYSQIPASAQNTPLAFPFSGLPGNGQKVLVPLTQNYTLPANFAGTVGYAETASTASAAFTLSFIRSGTPTTIGTVTFAIGSNSGTLSTQASVNLLAGDVLKLSAPSPQDTTLANVGITFVLLKT